jgi:hypothetical protein
MSAKTITVNCNSEMTISNALKELKPMEENSIRVIGTCHEEVDIENFAQLSIVGIGAGTGHAVMKGTANTPVFWIIGSHVQLTNLIIDGGQFGVMCREFSVCRFSGNTIENTTGNAVALDSADATFSGDVIQNNLNYGLIMTASRARLSQVTVKGTTAGPWGPGHGINVSSGSIVTVEKLTVQDNQGNGVSVNANSHLVNRPWAGPFIVSNNSMGGIGISEQSSGDLGGATVTNNTGGAGVVIVSNSEATFWGGGTFTGNDPLDVFCGPLNGIAAAPQLANIGSTNCPNTF